MSSVVAQTCHNCHLAPVLDGATCCDNHICGQEMHARDEFPSEYNAVANVGDDVFVVESPSGAKSRCVECRVMPAQHTVDLDGVQKKAGVCTELCRQALLKEMKSSNEPIGSWFEALRHRGFQSISVAEQIIAMMNAAAKTSSDGVVDYVDFLSQPTPNGSTYYDLVYEYVTNGGRRSFDQMDYQKWAEQVTDGAQTPIQRALVRFQRPATGIKFDFNNLAMKVGNMYKKTWKNKGTFLGLRSADARQYGARIFRDIRDVISDEDKIRAAMSAVFSWREVSDSQGLAPIAGSILDHIGAVLASATPNSDEFQTAEQHLLDIDASLTERLKGAAAGAKKLAVRGAKAVTGKTAALAAKGAGAAAESLTRVAIGEYSIDQVRTEIEPIVRLYAWFNARNLSVDLLSYLGDLTGFFTYHAGISSLISTQRTVASESFQGDVSILLSQFRTLTKTMTDLVQNVEATDTTKFVAAPQDMPVVAINYTRLARNIWGMKDANLDQNRSEKLRKDVKAMYQQLANKYMPRTLAVVPRLFSSIVQEIETQTQR